MVSISKYSFVIIVTLMHALSACDSEAPKTSGDTSTNQNHGKSPPFVAPEDNRLTEHHVRQYLAVQNTEKELLISQQENRLSDSAAEGEMRYQDIEQKAVQLNQLSLPEYEWIKNTVINSRIQQQFQEYFALNQQIIALLEGTLQRHETTKKDLKDPEEIAILDDHVSEIKGHIQTLKNQIEKYTNLSESEKHNIEMVKVFTAELEAIEKDQLSSQKKQQ
jgi:hypothetical protein